MEKRNLIVNKGKGENVPFYIVEENLDYTFEGAEEIKDGDENLLSFIDEKLYEIILINIKTEVKNAISSELY